MRFLYTLGIRIYTLLLRMVSPFHPKAQKWVKGRKNILDTFDEKPTNQKRVWIHTASLGEFEQGRPLIELLKKNHPNIYIHLTFFSPSGYDVRYNFPQVDSVSYIPIDTPRKTKVFLEKLQPNYVIFIKYEYWYNMMQALSKQGIPLFMTSAIFRKDQVFFKPYGDWFAKQLKSITHFFVQDKNSELLLQELGITNVSYSGDTRFDRVAELAKNPMQLPDIKTFKGQKKLFIAGSTWPKDEEIIAKAFKGFEEKCTLIIAPHEVHASHIEAIEKEFASFKCQRYSDYIQSPMEGCQVLIIDSIGKLMHLYQYGDWAYIGGGFNAGIHNILEAATYELNVCFGPNYTAFNEANDLIASEGAFCIHNIAELQTHLDRLLKNESFSLASKKTCKQYVSDNIGASKTILNHNKVKDLTNR